MQRSSHSVGALAAALAKAQAEIQNPEKSLTATIVSPGQRIASRQALRSTMPPMSTIMPVSSATGMNSPGETLTPLLSQRTSASQHFTLPVSTPPNAIAYGTGLIRIQSMVRFGFVLNLLAYLVLLGCGALLLPALGFGD